MTKATENHTSPLQVLVYSDNATTREQVKRALGRRPDTNLAELDYVEVATAPVVLARLEAGGIDLAILDGEAAPTGGLGLAKQLTDELTRPGSRPPILVLTGRPDDAWLASWSRADAIVTHPIDPIELTDTVVTLLRGTTPTSDYAVS